MSSKVHSGGVGHGGARRQEVTLVLCACGCQLLSFMSFENARALRALFFCVKRASGLESGGTIPCSSSLGYVFNADFFYTLHHATQ